MVVSRYTRTKVLRLGKQYGTSFAITAIRQNIENGNIPTQEMILDEGERIDVLAGRIYGDGRLFWVISGASNIGWTMQVPPGTRILIPNLDDILRFVG